jgi:branched-chain amino acid transport system substrate-binding protein
VGNFVTGLTRSAALIALLVAAALPAAAQTVKIGVINSFSGFLAQPGDEMEKGIELYQKEHDKDLPAGVKVELVKRDDQSEAETGKRVAQELITREHVQLLLGVIGSPQATAIAPLTAEAKIPFIITNAGGVTITRLSPYVVRDSFTQWHTALPLGKWAAEQGWKKGYTAVSDFIPGHDSEAAFTKGFTDAGGTIVGAVRFSPSSPDFPPVVQRILDVKPDVAFIWVPAGTQATGMMKAVKDLRVREAGIAVVSTQDLVPDEELRNIGDAGLGLVTAGIYSAAGDRPANKAFVAAWNKAYPGAVPDFFSADGWDGMAMAYALISKTKGKFTPDEAMAFLSNWKDEASPRGPIEIDPATRDVIQNVYMRKLEKHDGTYENVEFATIPHVKDPWKELNPPK